MKIGDLRAGSPVDEDDVVVVLWTRVERLANGPFGTS